jgi:type IV secretion system protein VirB1
MYWLHWFLTRRYTVSIGLMQVNSEMAPRFHLKPEQLLEPCTNLRVGAAILISVYTDLAGAMGEGFSALDAALSVYNSGNSSTGFRNGYVANVYAHAPRP